MTYVGIDVSKATFVVAYSSAKSSKTKHSRTPQKVFTSSFKPCQPMIIIACWKQPAITVPCSSIFFRKQELLSAWKILSR